MVIAEDLDSLETQEWLEAVESVFEKEGIYRAHYILDRLVTKARKSGAYLPYSATTAYLNTIPANKDDLFKKGGHKKLKVQLMGFGTILREVIAASDLLNEDWAHEYKNDTNSRNIIHI